MKATITVKTNGNQSTIIVKRGMATSIIPAAAIEVDRKVRNIVVNLSNAGYEVK